MRNFYFSLLILLLGGISSFKSFSQITVTASSTDVTCNGLSDGTITAVVSGSDGSNIDYYLYDAVTFALVATHTDISTTYTFIGVGVGTYAVNTEQGAFSDFSDVNVPVNQPDPVVPPDPTSVSNINCTSFRASWANIPEASSYRLDVKDNLNNFVGIYNDLNVGNVFAFDVTGLSPGTNYTFVVRAVSACQTSASSSSSGITTSNVLSAPTTMSASPVGCTSFTARWNANGAIDYDLEIYDTTPILIAQFPNVIGSSQNVTGLTAGTQYFYRVRARNTCGYSAFSGNQSVTTTSLPNTPVSNPVVTFNCTSFTATWNAAVGALNYRIDVDDDIAFGSPVLNNVLVPIGTSRNVTGLTPGVTYHFRVRGANACGFSGNSVVQNITLDTLTIAPTSSSTDRNNFCADDAGNIQLTAVGGSGATLSWYSGSCGGTLVGTGTPLSIASPVTSTTYFARWENSCGNSTCASIAVIVNPLPVAFNVTGGGAYCSGGVGVAVGLSGSQAGVNYQLQIGGVNSGAAVAGTGAAISFGNQTTAGTYTIVATNTLTTCTGPMTGSVNITIDIPPLAFNVTGGGAYCSGGAGAAVGLSGSEAGVNYQLQLGGVDTGAPVAGTGAAISFGNQTGAGTYTIVATRATCQLNMTGNVVITIDPLPTAFNVTGGGAYCSGGVGVAVGLSGSEVSVNYQLQLGGVDTGAPVAGTGAAISFGNQIAAGTYTIVATNTLTTCTGPMNGSAVITIDPLPTAFNVTGGGTYCAGGAGVPVGLSGSEAGVNYQLQLGGVDTGVPVAGTGAAISFGNQTGAGIYTVIGISGACPVVVMTGSVVITIDPLPVSFNLTGGGSYCAGGAGLPIDLSGSEAGVDYQLQIDGVNTGVPVAGTGAAISFGNQTAAGTYTIIATNAATTCTASMTGSAVIVVDPLPTSFNVSGGGTYCSGGPGLPVNLSGSDAGVSYQLQIGGVDSGAPVAGTGAAISFGNQTAAGTYTVIGISGACPIVAMTGSVLITIDPLPIAFNLTGGGSYCSGGVGVAVGLSGSQAGVDYQLQIGGINMGALVAGTGAAISFGNQTTAGTYTIIATNTATTCTVPMNGSAVITVDPLPIAFNVTGGGTYCSGNPGVPVNLSGSQLGVNYQLQIGGVDNGAPVAGTGAAISFGNQTITGTYTVIGTSGTCPSVAMNGSVAITVSPSPTAFNTTGGGAYCSGGPGLPVGVSNSELGVNYQLQIGGVNTGVPVAGTGAAISFGNQTAGGTYTIIGTNPVTTCTTSMTGSATITVDLLPIAFNVGGGGAYCSADPSPSVTLSGSEAGVNYQLQIGGVNTGGILVGTGAAISFGAQTVAGTYTVMGTRGACPSVAMTGSVAISVNPSPTTFNVTGGGAYCAGGAGLPVGLSGSQAGVNYQLQIGGVNTGVPVAGTGAAISFGNRTTAGTYTIIATNQVTACTSPMTGSVIITIDVAPNPNLTVNSDAGVCFGNSAGITIVSSENGVTYELRRVSDGVLVASGLGTGADLIFSTGPLSSTTQYNIFAIRGTCNVQLTTSPNIIVLPLGSPGCAIPICPTSVKAFQTPVTCSGVNNGEAIAVQIGGSNVTLEYQLVVNSIPVGAFQASPDFSGRSIGDKIKIRVQGQGGLSCTPFIESNEIVITDSLTFFASVQVTDASCAGTGGIVAFRGMNGFGNYTFTLNGVTQPDSTFTNLADGTYPYTITDSKGCSFSGTATVGRSSTPPTIVLTSNQANYCTGSNGVFTATSITGATYTFRQSGNPTPLYNGSSNIYTYNSLPAGQLTINVGVTVPGCASQGAQSTTVNVYNNTPIPSAPDTVYICEGNPGPTLVSVQGVGTNLRWYKQAGRKGFIATTQTLGVIITDLEVPVTNGNIDTVFVTQDMGLNCGGFGTESAEKAVFIKIINSTPPAPAVANPQAFCPTDTVPTVVAQGTNVRWYTRKDKTGFITASNAFTPVLPANYEGDTTFYVTQSIANCGESGVDSVTFTSTQAACGNGCNLQILAVVTPNFGCTTSPLGSIDLTNVNGGSGKYQYKLQTIPVIGPGTFVSTSLFDNLLGSLYQITVRDTITNCSVVDTVNLGSAPLVNAIATLKLKCADELGSVNLLLNEITGGSGSYSLSKDGGITYVSGTNITGISKDDNLLIRDDITNCFLNVMLIKDVPDLLDATFTTIAEASCNNNDGAVKISNIGGGTGGKQYYKYQLQGKDITIPSDSIFKGLDRGEKILTMIDSIGCSKAVKFVVPAPGLVILDVATTPATCLGDGKDGTAFIKVDDFLSAPGPYEIAVNSQIFQPFSGDTLLINLSNNQEYVLTVRTVAIGCPNERRFTVGGLAVVDFTLQAEHVKCKTENNGKIIIKDMKGDFTMPFDVKVTIDNNVTYQNMVALSKGQDFTISNLYTGLYNVEIKQNNICSGFFADNDNIEVDEPRDFLAATLGVVTESLPLPEAEDRPTGTAQIKDIRGGTPPYQIQLEGVETTNDIDVRPYKLVKRNATTFKYDTTYTKMRPGKYEAMIKDANGCELKVLIDVPFDTKVFVPNVFTPNNDGKNDLFFIRNLPPQGSRLTITNRWGKIMYQNNNYNEKELWNGGNLPEGVYYYRLDLNSPENKSSYTGFVEIWRGDKDFK